MASTINARIAKGKYETAVTVRNHALVADESEELGGRDKGPSPGDFLRISLATCTAITLRMYADRKKWEIDEIDVSVSSSSADGVTTFVREIKLMGTIDETQRARLKQIANACPVHKTLTNPIVIETNVA